MIGLDTNVVVRYLTQDDPVQSPQASRIMEKRLSAANPWVLDHAYGFAPTEIAAAIERILQADTLVVENEQEVFAATVALRKGSGGFADALIGAIGVKAGCSRTLTFDRKAARLPGFALV